MIQKIDASLTVRLFHVVDFHLRGDLQPWRRIRVRTGGLLYVAGHPEGLGLPNRNIDMSDNLEGYFSLS